MKNKDKIGRISNFALAFGLAGSLLFMGSCTDKKEVERQSIESAQKHLDEKDYHSALKAARRAIDANENSHKGYFWVAYANYALGNMYEYYKNISKAIELEPRYASDFFSIRPALAAELYCRDLHPFDTPDNANSQNYNVCKEPIPGPMGTYLHPDRTAKPGSGAYFLDAFSSVAQNSPDTVIIPKGFQNPPNVPSPSYSQSPGHYDYESTGDDYFFDSVQKEINAIVSLPGLFKEAHRPPTELERCADEGNADCQRKLDEKRDMETRHHNLVMDSLDIQIGVAKFNTDRILEDRARERFNEALENSDHTSRTLNFYSPQ